MNIKNQDHSNPLPILSLAMMFRFSFNQNSIAEKIEFVVTKTLDQGFRTKDISTDSLILLQTMKLVIRLDIFFNIYH